MRVMGTRDVNRAATALRVVRFWKILPRTSRRVARLALLEPKTRNLALLRSSWLQNFHLAIWLLLGSFATFTFHKFFLEKS